MNLYSEEEKKLAIFFVRAVFVHALQRLICVCVCVYVGLCVSFILSLHFLATQWICIGFDPFCLSHNICLYDGATLLRAASALFFYPAKHLLYYYA